MYFDNIDGYDITLCSNNKCRLKNKCLRHLEYREDITYWYADYTPDNNCYVEVPIIEIDKDKAEKFIKGNSKYIGKYYYRDKSLGIHLFHSPDYDAKLNHKEYPFLYTEHNGITLYISGFTKEEFEKLVKYKQLISIE